MELCFHYLNGGCSIFEFEYEFHILQNRLIDKRRIEVTQSDIRQCSDTASSETPESNISMVFTEGPETGEEVGEAYGVEHVRLVNVIRLISSAVVVILLLTVVAVSSCCSKRGNYDDVSFLNDIK